MQINIKIYQGDGTNRNYVDIETDDMAAVTNAIGENLINDNYRVKYVLRRVFENHGDFYDYIGFDAGNTHGSSGTSFSSTGFRRFMVDFWNHDNYINRMDDENQRQQVADAIAGKISDLIEENDGVQEEHAASSVVRLGKPGDTFNDPEVVKDSLVVTEDGTYKLQLQEIQGATSMSEIEGKISDGMKETYKNQLESRVNAYKNRIERLEEKMEQQRAEMLVKGLRMVGELDDWEVEGEYLVYQKRINLKWASRKYEDENPQKLTEEAQEKFYIDGLKIHINSTIGEPRYEEAYHPHALGSGVCTGDFTGAPLEEGLEKVVEQLQQANLHGRGHCDAERDFKDNFDEYIAGRGDSDAEEPEEGQETLEGSEVVETPENTEEPQEREVFNTG